MAIKPSSLVLGWEALQCGLHIPIHSQSSPVGLSLRCPMGHSAAFPSLSHFLTALQVSLGITSQLLVLGSWPHGLLFRELKLTWVMNRALLSWARITCLNQVTQARSAGQPQSGVWTLNGDTRDHKPRSAQSQASSLTILLLLASHRLRLPQETLWAFQRVLFSSVSSSCYQPCHQRNLTEVGKN